MKKRVRICSFMLVLLCFISSVFYGGSCTVYADDLGTAINAIGGWNYDEEELGYVENTIGLLVAALSVDGYTPEAIAGILSNIQHESAFDPFIVTSGLKKSWEAYKNWKNGDESYTYPNYEINGGIGLFQWTYDRHATFSEYCQTHAESMVINNRWQMHPGASYQTTSYCGDIDAQISFLIQENVWHRNEYIVGARVVDRAAYKEMTDAALAAKVWALCFEVPSGDLAEVASYRAGSASAWLSIINGDYNFADYVDAEQAFSLGFMLYSEGYWTDAQLSEYCQMLGLEIIF